MTCENFGTGKKETEMALLSETIWGVNTNVASPKLDEDPNTWPDPPGVPSLWSEILFAFTSARDLYRRRRAKRRDRASPFFRRGIDVRRTSGDNYPGNSSWLNGDGGTIEPYRYGYRRHNGCWIPNDRRIHVHGDIVCPAADAHVYLRRTRGVRARCNTRLE